MRPKVCILFIFSVKMGKLRENLLTIATLLGVMAGPLPHDNDFDNDNVLEYYDDHSAWCPSRSALS